MEEGETVLTKRRLMHLVDFRVLVSNLYPKVDPKSLDRECTTFIAALEKLPAVAS